MKKKLFQFIFICFVFLFVFSESFSMDEAGQEKKSSNFIEKIKKKNNMNTQEAVAAVFKTGIICVTVGGVVYHVANKFHEKPEIWAPVLILGGGLCVVGAARLFLFGLLELLKNQSEYVSK